jgi:hypothetical protein
MGAVFQEKDFGARLFSGPAQGFAGEDQGPLLPGRVQAFTVLSAGGGGNPFAVWLCDAHPRIEGP